MFLFKQKNHQIHEELKSKAKMIQMKRKICNIESGLRKKKKEKKFNIQEIESRWWIKPTKNLSLFHKSQKKNPKRNLRILCSWTF